MTTLPDSDALVVPVFKILSTFDDGASTREGRAIYKDQEVVEIRLGANKQTVGVFPAHEVCGFVDGPDGTRTKQTYAMKYNAQYLAFRNGEAQVLGGTSLELLPFLEPHKRLELKALNIYTAEALAELDGQPLKRLGMGGRDLKNKAIAFLADKTNNDVAATAAIVARQDKRIAELEAQLGLRNGGAAAPATDEVDEETAANLAAVDKALAASGGNFQAFKAKAKKVLGDDTPATKADIVALLEKVRAELVATPAEDEAAMSEFDSYEDDDIRNWLKDAKVEGVDAMDRAALIAKAEEVNAQLKADKAKAA